MLEQSLNGAWQLHECGTDDWLPGRVPGGVHLDLMAAGRISDPFVCDEELRVQWVAERDWEYRREFVVEAGVAAAGRLDLVFDGLDTLADIRLNGELLGSADNMFRTWRWDVTGLVRPGKNELAVVFRSAVRAGAEMDAIRHLDAANDQLTGAPHLRKAPCHFGWDWGPKLPNIGFWQGVRLEGWGVGRLDDVRLSQSMEAGHATVAVQVEIERADSGGAADGAPEVEVAIRIEHPDGTSQVARSVVPGKRSVTSVEVEIDDPELWWPNGLGGQPLYRVQVELVAGGRRLDARTFRVGLRTLALRREPDEWGESLEFVVNGVPVFAKGSNWIPADSFPARVTTAQLDALLGAAAETNHNMIRVWGGGYYETEAFYDACDRLGILVWQDFMFACSVYPLTDAAYLANVEVEVREQVRRLRHRACLALWCGNNEMEAGWADWGWDRSETAELKAAYLRFFGETLPEWVSAEDGATPYWPSSPSSGNPLVEPLGETTGDYHQWTVWHNLAPFDFYTEHTYRFVSEFGFESLPAMTTIQTFAADPADWNLGSPILDLHQKNPAGNAKILYYLAQQFRLPREFEGLVYLSQVLQAEAMRVGVEHWRRERARCGGAMYWQLNDCWPVSSWAGIDYFGRWKALHYATRRFYAPVLLSCSLGDGEAAIALTNDRAEPWRGTVRWSLERLDGSVESSGEVAAAAAGCATAQIARIPAPASIDERRSRVLVAELVEAGSRRSLVVTPFVPDKHLALTAPTLEVSVKLAPAGQAVVRLESDTLARWVELALDGADTIFSDNYFDLPARRQIEVSFAFPADWSIERVRQALKVRSVVDTYA
jgi:beta-mannosidase